MTNFECKATNDKLFSKLDVLKAPCTREQVRLGLFPNWS